ncbi:MAG: acetyl-CoA carboxylase carboxyltransferase subunit, partial [Gammaproteobacteria bacterium]|nr:acetyl-CoA carboxylase carboxyltransferase subunit [Gammaproteobacteria bacterium]MBU1832973.1 acetyl-CoA carboxylase carboxyltransferase subunit [Gammaproteobacteria bacterium]
QNLKAGMPESESVTAAKEAVAEWQKQEELLLTQRYERELMNPNEALSLGSISQIVMPSDLRKVLGEQLELHLKAYKPEPMGGMQREFH